LIARSRQTGPLDKPQDPAQNPDPKGARWKNETAVQFHRNVAAPYCWIADALNAGSPLANV
jgi:hypothetical protein